MKWMWMQSLHGGRELCLSTSWRIRISKAVNTRSVTKM